MSSKWFRARPIHCRRCLCGGGTLVKIEKDIYQHKDERFCKTALRDRLVKEKQLEIRQKLQVGVAPA